MSTVFSGDPFGSAGLTYYSDDEYEIESSIKCESLFSYLYIFSNGLLKR